MALFFFTGALWALGHDGTLDFSDGLVLVGIFLFWQVLHVFDVLKYNIHQRRSLSWTIMVDALLVVALGAGILHGIDRLVAWVMALGPGVHPLRPAGHSQRLPHGAAQCGAGRILCLGWPG